MDGSGNAVNREFYYPFGGNRGSAFSDLTSKRFTGQYHEKDLPGGEGLSYYNARWYDAQLGRFVSADTIVPNPANPQAFNRYTYVLNSPLGHIDPSGHEPCPSGNWGDCLPPSKNNDPVRNSTRLYNQQSSYSSKGTRWEDVPGETRAYWRTWGINKGRYQDCCGNAKLQKGLKDPATVLSGVVGGWRLGGQALRLAPQAFRWLTGGATAACADGDCGNEAYTLENAVRAGLNAIRTGTGQAYRTFSAFKYHQGSAGPGYAWHHIVPQTPQNMRQFGAQAVHNTNNLIRLPHGRGSIHQQISNYYNSIQPRLTGSDTLRVRDWLATRSFEDQWRFGVNLIQEFGGEQFIIQQFGGR